MRRHTNVVPGNTIMTRLATSFRHLSLLLLATGLAAEDQPAALQKQLEQLRRT